MKLTRRERNPNPRPEQKSNLVAAQTLSAHRPAKPPKPTQHCSPDASAQPSQPRPNIRPAREPEALTDESNVHGPNRALAQPKPRLGLSC